MTNLQVLADAAQFQNFIDMVDRIERARFNATDTTAVHHIITHYILQFTPKLSKQSDASVVLQRRGTPPPEHSRITRRIGKLAVFSVIYTAASIIYPDLRFMFDRASDASLAQLHFLHEENKSFLS